MRAIVQWAVVAVCSATWCGAPIGVAAVAAFGVATVVATPAGAQTLNLPPRPRGAPNGRAFLSTIAPLTLQEREEAIYTQVTAGNVPNFLRTLVPVTVQATTNGVTHSATFYVAPEYLVIGSDDDYVLMSMTPTLAQRIANRLDCSLPTPKMVDAIYAAAAVKLRPQNITPTPAMTTVPVFAQHNDSVAILRREQLAAHPLGALVAGHQKDIVITNEINNPAPKGRVAIYGWHRLNGEPIQQLYIGHVDWWADYSHGVRLVQQAILVDGAPRTVREVLNTDNLALLLSDEGLVPNAKYPTPEPRL